MQPTRNYKALAIAVVGCAAAMGLVACGWFGWRVLLIYGAPMRAEAWRPYFPIFGGMLACGAIVYLAFRMLDRLGVRPPE